MSISHRLVSAIFTALPGLFFLIFFLQTDWLGRDYWWGTYLTVLSILLSCSLMFGFVFPPVFQALKMPRPWVWILLQGLLAWGIALVVLGFLNMTPLCVGQNNGDGNNDLGMCVVMTALSGIIYTPVYLGMLILSALIGHWLARLAGEPP